MTPFPRVARTAAQAKVNLGLRILAREPDGYHALETFFHRIDLADDVRVERTAASRSLTVDGPAMPAGGLGPPEANLAWRAAAAYLAHAGLDEGFAITIEKRIPVGGGLGGGSADAGAVLRAMDALHEGRLGPARVVALGAALGADVAFLASDAVAALGTGRGDRLATLPPLPSRPVAVLVPPFAIATADAYRWLADGRGSYVPRAAVLHPALLASWDVLSTGAVNDFEGVVASRHPEIARTVVRLRDAGARLAMMSGSGSTVFGVFDDVDAADAADRLRDLPGGATIAWTRSADRVVPVALDG